MLLLTACIWGFAFVPQKTSMEHIGPFTYNSIRFLLGGLALAPVMFVRARRRGAYTTINWSILLPASVLVGSILFVAVNLQQLGLVYINPGNSGFITGMYVVFVPVFGVFLGRKTGLPTWIGVALAFSGLFCVSIAAEFPSPDISGKNGGHFLDPVLTAARMVNKGDGLTLIGAFFWTFHVLFIDIMVKRVDAIHLSFGQCAVCGTLSLGAAALNITELTGVRAETLRLAAEGIVKPLGPELFSPELTLAAFSGSLIQLLYGGILAVGVAYTLQVVAQRHAPPAHATIILSLESVFAAVGGILLTAETVNTAKLMGFALILGGILATQRDIIASGRHSARIRPDSPT